MSAAGVQPRTASELPSNGVWSKGSAPAARYQALTAEMQQVQQDVFGALNAKGAGPASQDVMQRTRQELEGLRSDLMASMPNYPDPAKDVQPLLDAAQAQDFNPDSWSITYSTNSPNGQGSELVEYEGNPGDSSYSTDDQIAPQLSSMSDGIQKIEDLVNKSMQNPLPFQEQTQRVDLFWKKKTSEILTNKFNQLSSTLTPISAAAQSVNAAGISETGTTSYTYYVPIRIGKIMENQPHTEELDFAKGSDGKWNLVSS